jgi:hypothetical protein
VPVVGQELRIAFVASCLGGYFQAIVRIHVQNPQRCLPAFYLSNLFYQNTTLAGQVLYAKGLSNLPTFKMLGDLSIDLLVGKQEALHKIGCDLDNDIHPILARENWPDNIKYEVLLPALRLLSHILESEAVLIYVDALFLTKHQLCQLDQETSGEDDGTWKEMTYESREWGVKTRADLVKSFLRMQPKASLTPEQRNKAKEYLLHIGQVTRFEISPETGKGSACCFSTSNTGGMPPRVPETFVGRPATMRLAQDDYEALLKLDAVVSSSSSSSSTTSRRISSPAQLQLECAFYFASTILHGFAHVLQHVRRPWFSAGHEVVLGDNTLTEAGYDLETVVWGSTIHCTFNGSQAEATPALAREWPCPMMQGIYMHDNLTMLCTGTLARPHTVRQWSVRTSWITDLFRKSFWEEFAALPAAEAAARMLQPPKILGQMTYAHSCVCRGNPWLNGDRMKGAFTRTTNPECALESEDFPWPPEDSAEWKKHLAAMVALPRQYIVFEDGLIVRKDYEQRLERAALPVKGGFKGMVKRLKERVVGGKDAKDEVKILENELLAD